MTSSQEKSQDVIHEATSSPVFRACLFGGVVLSIAVNGAVTYFSSMAKTNSPATAAKACAVAVGTILLTAALYGVLMKRKGRRAHIALFTIFFALVLAGAKAAMWLFPAGS